MTQTEYHAQVAHCKRDIFYQPLTGRIVDGSRIKVAINLIRIDVTEIDFGYIIAAGLGIKSTVKIGAGNLDKDVP